MVAAMAGLARSPGGVQQLRQQAGMPQKSLYKVYRGKERSGQKLLRLSDPGICIVLNVHTPYSLKILGKSLTLKMEVPAAGPRKSCQF